MKKKLTTCLYTALFLLCVTACNNKSSYQNTEGNIEIAEMLNTTRTLLFTAPDSALALLNEINRKTLTYQEQANLLYQKAFINQLRGKFDSAHSLYLQAHQFSITANDTILISRILTGLGVINAMSGNIQQSIGYWQQARLILGSHKNAHNYLPSLYVNLAGAFSAIQQTDYAKHYIQSAIDKALAKRKYRN